MRGFVLTSLVAVLLLALCLLLGANAGEPGAAIAIGVIFGVGAAIPVHLGLALIRRETRPAQPTQYITHQHLHVYQFDEQGQAVQIREATREVAAT